MHVLCNAMIDMQSRIKFTEVYLARPVYRVQDSRLFYDYVYEQGCIQHISTEATCHSGSCCTPANWDIAKDRTSTMKVCGPDVNQAHEDTQ